MGSNATQPRKRLGAWLARANNTVYQAATDGTVHCFRSGDGDTHGFTDAATPPTIRRQANLGWADHYAGFSMNVKKGDYWEVTLATTVYWIPWEP